MLAGNSYKKWENISALNYILMLIFNMRAREMMNFQDVYFPCAFGLFSQGKLMLCMFHASVLELL